MTEYAEILKVCGGAILAAVCIILLRSTDRTGMSTVTALFFSVLLTVGALGAAVPVFREMKEFLAGWAADDHASVLLRGMAVGMTVQFTSDLIRDAGEQALAEKVDMFGRAALLSIGLPLIRELLALAKGFLVP